MPAEPIHQDDKGRWELRYRDPTGRPRRKRFPTKREARDFHADLRMRAQAGTWTAPESGRLPLAQWVEEWWGTAVHLRPATKARYERDLRLHILPAFGGVQIARISPRQVRAWVAEMVANGERPSAVRRRFSVLRKILGDAVAMEMVSRNPSRGVRPPADTRSEITVLEPVEIRDLADAIHPWFRTWIWFAAYSGLRWSEMLGVRRRDVDLLGRTVTVHQQIIEVNGRFLGFGDPKTAAGKRTVDLPAFLCRCSKNSSPSGLRPARTDWRSSTLAATHRTLELLLADLEEGSSFCRAARVAAGTTSATRLLLWPSPRVLTPRPSRSGWGMGHASITITLDRYGHLFPALGRQVADGLDMVYRYALLAPPAARPIALGPFDTRRGITAAARTPQRGWAEPQQSHGD